MGKNMSESQKYSITERLRESKAVATPTGGLEVAFTTNVIGSDTGGFLARRGCFGGHGLFLLSLMFVAMVTASLSFGEKRV